MGNLIGWKKFHLSIVFHSLPTHNSSDNLTQYPLKSDQFIELCPLSSITCTFSCEPCFALLFSRRWAICWHCVPTSVSCCRKLFVSSARDIQSTSRVRELSLSSSTVVVSLRICASFSSAELDRARSRSFTRDIFDSSCCWRAVFFWENSLTFYRLKKKKFQKLKCTTIKLIIVLFNVQKNPYEEGWLWLYSAYNNQHIVIQQQIFNYMIISDSMK